MLNAFSVSLSINKSGGAMVEQVDDTDTDSVNFPLCRFESCPDYKNNQRIGD